MGFAALPIISLWPAGIKGASCLRALRRRCAMAVEVHRIIARRPSRGVRWLWRDARISSAGH